MIAKWQTEYAEVRFWPIGGQIWHHNTLNTAAKIEWIWCNAIKFSRLLTVLVDTSPTVRLPLLLWPVSYLFCILNSSLATKCPVPKSKTFWRLLNLHIFGTPVDFLTIPFVRWNECLNVPSTRMVIRPKDCTLINMILT